MFKKLLFSISDAKYEDFKKHEPTEAVVGKNITLPCVPEKFSINLKDDVVNWKKNGEKIVCIKEKHDHIKEDLKVRKKNTC